MPKPARHQRPRVINAKGQVVGGEAPGRFKLRYDFGLDKVDSEVVIRCQFCSWSRRTRVSRMAGEHAAHLALKHGGVS